MEVRSETVGLVFIACAVKDKSDTICQKFNFNGDREEVRSNVEKLFCLVESFKTKHLEFTNLARYFREMDWSNLHICGIQYRVNFFSLHEII